MKRMNKIFGRAICLAAVMGMGLSIVSCGGKKADAKGTVRFLNFKPEEGITVTGVKFAGKNFQVTDNLWNYTTISDLGTKSLVIYMTKDGNTYYTPEIKIQTAKGCITSSTIAFEFTNNKMVMTANAE